MSGQPIPAPPALRVFVIGVVASVALLDLVSGIYLMTSVRPWLAHGGGTIWVDVASRIGSDPVVDAALLSLWHRVGAFSVFAGLSTLTWLVVGLRDRRVLTVLLVMYLIAGVPFGVTDAAHFEGTPYLLGKRVIGLFWVLALVAHWLGRPRDP